MYLFILFAGVKCSAEEILYLIPYPRIVSWVFIIVLVSAGAYFFCSFLLQQYLSKLSNTQQNERI